MKRIALIFALGAATLLAQAPAERSKPHEAIEAEAKEKLNQMTGFLKTLKTFEITSQSSRDEIVATDMKIQRNADIDITVQLPARLHADLRGDRRNLEFFYDGQTLTVYSANHNYYAATPTPPTVSRTLDAIRVRHGTVFPLADFIHMAAGEDLLKEMSRAGYLGVSRVDGVECDHVAVRQPNVDWQVWIERSERPVPRKIVITNRTEPTQPQYSAVLTWNFAPTIDKQMFTFTPPPDAVRIKFARVQEAGRDQ